ncbi:uncharacterized protein FRV6_13275 [Fusarium oxysporum]|uniref:Uncharacterized protein n=1 Tax=Fusarium oxysporum TaxID=5507 RepID=A0A2H3TKP9_FUSOX|nr:uncharacterized protein FRV6_13275 [Fusarium oxysporum]
MHFNFGGWKDSKAVYSHAYIKRLAAHLFGHALRLLPEVAGQLLNHAPRSPVSLRSNGADVLQGGRVIDNEACSLLQSLYPSWPKPVCGRYNAKNLGGFKEGLDANGDLNLTTTKTNNIVVGLCRLDMGTNGNFRLRSKVANIKQKEGYTWEVGIWSDTNLFDASYYVLSFEKEDERVQTRHTDWKYLSGGKSRSTYRRFTRPFKSVPEVGCLYYGV